MNYLEPTAPIARLQLAPRKLSTEGGRVIAGAADGPRSHDEPGKPGEVAVGRTLERELRPRASHTIRSILRMSPKAKRELAREHLETAREDLDAGREKDAINALFYAAEAAA